MKIFNVSKNSSFLLSLKRGEVSSPFFWKSNAKSSFEISHFLNRHFSEKIESQEVHSSQQVVGSAKTTNLKNESQKREDEFVEYIPITSSNNDSIKHSINLRKSKNFRYTRGIALIAGKKMIEDALSMWWNNYKIFSTRKEDKLRDSFLIQKLYISDKGEGKSLPKIPSFVEEILKKWRATNPSPVTKDPKYPWKLKAMVAPRILLNRVSGLETYSDAIAEVKLPFWAFLRDQTQHIEYFNELKNSGKAKFIVVLDNVSDPGNVGTLLRGCLGLGWDLALSVHNSADTFNEKTIRASSGAIFSLPVLPISFDTLQKILNNNPNMLKIAADVHSQEESLYSKSPQLVNLNLNQVEAYVKEKIPPSSLDGVILFLGHETAGLSHTLVKLSDIKLTIPMYNGMDSLNVAQAASIMMYSLKAQLPIQGASKLQNLKIDPKSKKAKKMKKKNKKIKAATQEKENLDQEEEEDDQKKE